MIAWVLFCLLLVAVGVAGELAFRLRAQRREHAAAIAAVTMTAYEKANADIDAEMRAMYRDGLAAKFALGKAKAAWARYRSVRQAGRRLTVVDLVRLRGAVAEVDASLMGLEEKREVANG